MASAREEFVKVIRQFGFEITNEKERGRVLVIETDMANRLSVLTHLGNTLQRIGIGCYHPENQKHSKLGCVEAYNGSVSLIVKPSVSGTRAGIANEDMLLKHIKEAQRASKWAPITIVFRDHRGIEEVIWNVTDCWPIIHSGRNKADIIIEYDSGAHVNISVKKDSAQSWESADSYYGRRASETLDSLRYLGLENLENFAVRANRREARDVIFGDDCHGDGVSDLFEPVQRGTEEASQRYDQRMGDVVYAESPRGAVIIRTFTEEDFEYKERIGKDKRVLFINTSCILKTLKDVTEELWPYFLFRKDSSRNSEHLPKGYRCVASFASRVPSTTLVLNRRHEIKGSLDA
jgi:hypothetical protein